MRNLVVVLGDQLRMIRPPLTGSPPEFEAAEFRRVCRGGRPALNSTAPIQSVEGYVRQILGWREFMRGAYCFYAEVR